MRGQSSIVIIILIILSLVAGGAYITTQNKTTTTIPSTTTTVSPTTITILETTVPEETTTILETTTTIPEMVTTIEETTTTSILTITTVQTMNPWCIDSDNGEDIYTLGYVTVSFGGDAIYGGEDRCINKTHLSEGFCELSEITCPVKEVHGGEFICEGEETRRKFYGLRTLGCLEGTECVWGVCESKTKVVTISGEVTIDSNDNSTKDTDVKSIYINYYIEPEPGETCIGPDPDRPGLTKCGCQGGRTGYVSVYWKWNWTLNKNIGTYSTSFTIEDDTWIAVSWRDSGLFFVTDCVCERLLVEPGKSYTVNLEVTTIC